MAAWDQVLSPVNIFILLCEKHLRCRHQVLVGTSLAAFHQLAAIGGSLVEVNEERSVVVEVVTLQPAHHDQDLTWFHPKKLTAGRMIKVDHFLRSAFHTQRAEEGKMREELPHLRSPDNVPSLSTRKGKTCHFVPSDAGTDLRL